MTAARISPAASLLRNSRLFALPPSISLPPIPSSSEPVPGSDTATTIYPTRAAIETPQSSLNRGDWGLKRSLPLKSTLRSGHPTVRLNRAIDTAEHIADFDSAADHVLTLQKFQELGQNIEVTPSRTARTGDKNLSAFDRSVDNTTNVSSYAPGKIKQSGVWPDIAPSDIPASLPKAIGDRLKELVESGASVHVADKPAESLSQKDLKRWRYGGPSLVQLSGMQFDQYLKSLDETKRAAFREYLRQDLVRSKHEASRARARDEGTMGDLKQAEVSEEELSEYLRQLRQQPRKFGPLLASFLDLPAGFEKNRITGDSGPAWSYVASGRASTLPSDLYRETGPPRTHPSAGLSYLQSGRHADNDAIFGPQLDRRAVVARAVKTKTTRARGPSGIPISKSEYGVAGFVVKDVESMGRDDRSSRSSTPTDGGNKIPVAPTHASVSELGALQLSVKNASSSSGFRVQDGKAIHYSMVDYPAASSSDASGTRYGVSAPPRPRPQPKATEYKKLEPQESDPEVDALLKSMMTAASQARNR